MGLFSSKKKVKVNVTVQRLFEDSQIPDSARQGVIKGILNDGSLVDYMMEDIAGSIGVRVNTALARAKRSNYYFGIPSSKIKSNIDARSVVLSTIASNVGKSITPTYYVMAPMNSFHFAWTWLVNTHRYNPQTNELLGLSASTGKPCYLKSMLATYTKESYDFMQETYDMGMVEQLGPSPSSGYTPSNPFTSLGTIGNYAPQPTYEVSSVAVDDYVTIKYEFESTKGVFVERGITLPLSSIDLTQDFHQCRYVQSDGKIGFFTYQQGSGTYPLIDNVFALTFDNLGTYYPWIYFRVDDTRVLYLSDPKAYTDAKKISEYLGVDYDMLEQKVHEDPNVVDVQQSMLMFGITPGDKDETCIEYLFKYFSLLHANAIPAPDKANGLDDKFNAFTTSPSQIQVIQDKFFKQTFQFSGIAKQRKPGKIGKVGLYTSEYAVVGQKDQSFLTNGPKGVGTRAVTNGQPAWIYRFQVTDSVFEEIAIYGLRVNYDVHKKKGYGAGATSDRMLVPVDKEVLRTLGMRKKERVLCRGLQFFVSTAVTITTPWYASGAFKIVMLIVAVVITVLSSGTAWQTIVAAAALGAAALTITIITYIVTTLAIQYGVKLFVKQFGPQLGIIAAIAAVVVGAYASSDLGTTWGETLVSVGNNLVNESSLAYQDAVSDMMKDFEDFEKYAQGQFDNLKDKAEQLGLNGQNVGLEPLEMVYRVPDIRIGETPNDFYNRTVHSGNIGVTSFDMVENFASLRLTLPTLADTQMEEGDEDGMAI